MSRPIRPGNTGLVGLPVFLTAVFCFALVFMHSGGQNGNSRTVSSSGAIGKKPAMNVKTKPSKKLPAHHDAAAEPTSTGAQASELHVGSTASSAAAAHTGTPQPSNNSVRKLQSAAQNDGSSGASLIKSELDRAEKAL